MDTSKISKSIGREFMGENRSVKGVATIYNQKKGALFFCNKKRISRLENICEGTIIVPNDTPFVPQENHSYILSSSPRLDFIKAMRILYPNQLEPNIQIGENSNIASTAVLGEDGFGHEKNEEGRYERFPCIGGIRIGNDVDIGAYTTVDRGTIDDTIIEDGVKIDNHGYIAHNVHIGQDSLIMARVSIAGSTKIGKNCTLGIGSTIRNAIEIGENTFIGMGSVVTENIPANVMAYGVPAKVVSKR